MASNDDAEVDVRRNKRKVRGRRKAKTTTTTVDDAVVPNDNADLSTAGETLEVEAAMRDGLADALAATAVPDRCEETPATTINGNIDDSELTALPRSEITDGGDLLGVQPPTGIDDTALDHGRHPPQDDQPSHPPHGASKKSRGKRRVKNRERRAAQMTIDVATEQPLNGHEEVGGDWFTAVRSADIATVRRLAQSRAIDVNSTDEVSRDNKQ